MPQRLGNGHPNIVPYDVFPVADGHIIIATGNDGQWRKLCEVLGEPTLADHPDYLDNKSRVKNRAQRISSPSGRTSWPRACATNPSMRERGNGHGWLPT